MMPGTVSPPPKRPGCKWPGFLINRSGLPFDDLTWTELWEFAGYLYPESRATIREVQSAPLLQDVPYLLPPPIALAKQGRVIEYLFAVQKYMEKLTYNHTGTQFFETRPNSSMITLMETAKAMVRESLPIKCMEAIVLAIFLTNGAPNLGRFPINFKSELPTASTTSAPALASTSSRLQAAMRLGGEELSSESNNHSNNDSGGAGSNKRFYYHVVLGLTHGNKFGSIGLSRRSNLMDKPLEFSSLYDLINEFDEAYRDCGQRLVKIRVGHLVSHDPHSIAPIPWKGITIYPRAEPAQDVRVRVEKYSRELKSTLRIR